MHGERGSNEKLLAALRAPTGVEVAVCAPFPYIPQVAAALVGGAIQWGAQTCSEHREGAFTGEVSARMLADLGCKYVIVGHSERRALFGESDSQVAAKFAAAQAAALIPVLCVGETLAEREAGATETVVLRQLNAVLAASGVAAMAKAVLAYEPVWAIGTGKTATSAQAQSVHATLRTAVAAHDPAIARGLQILYGGSVKPANAGELFAMADINGGLIGGASLVAADFIAIAAAAASASA